MVEANMLEAKTKLSQLVEAAERGEQVFLKRNGIPVAQIISIPNTRLPFGFLKGDAGSVEGALLFDSSDEEVEDFHRL